MGQKYKMKATLEKNETGIVEELKTLVELTYKLEAELNLALNNLEKEE